MNERVVKSTLVVLLTASSTPYVTADTGYYLGVKAGYARFADKIDIDGAKISARDGTGYSLYGGYEFTKNYAIDLEYTLWK